MSKISSYANEALSLAAGDLLDVSKNISPGVYQTQKLNYSTLLTELEIDMDLHNILNGTANQTMRHNGTTWVASSVLVNNGTKIGINVTSPNNDLQVYRLINFDNGIKGTFVGYYCGNDSGTPSGQFNVGYGYEALRVLTSGAGNVGIGYQALNAVTTGAGNVAVGYQALKSVTTFGLSVAIGQSTLALYTGSAVAPNVGVGSLSLDAITTGGGNTALGHEAGSGCVVGDRNVFLGRASGFHETGSDKLFIDNQARNDEADGRAKALVYGKFATTTAAQIFGVNANLGIGIGDSSFGASADFVLGQKNGTAPTTNITDAYQLYSADIAVGNAAPHVKTENGDVVKIYAIGGWGTPTGTLTRTTFATFAGQTITNPPTQTEVQNIDNHVKILSERLAALISDMKTGHQSLKA